MARITEKELILPSLHVINEQADKKIKTSDLIKELRKLLNPTKEDTEILQGRKDDKFSQKVRNLRVHRTLEKDEYTKYENGFFEITTKGEENLENNRDKLNDIISEELFLNKSSEINTLYYNDFLESVGRIDNFLLENTEFRNDMKNHFYSMLFSSLITSLETYLSDALKFNINSNKFYKLKFVETFKDFKDVKCDFNNIYTICDSIDNKIEEKLLGLLYHNLPKIKGIYKDTFGIEFSDIGELMKNVKIRHDLVHRNGRKGNNNFHIITNEIISGLSTLIKEFSENVENQFSRLNEES